MYSAEFRRSHRRRRHLHPRCAHHIRHVTWQSCLGCQRQVFLSAATAAANSSLTGWQDSHHICACNHHQKNQLLQLSTDDNRQAPKCHECCCTSHHQYTKVTNKHPMPWTSSTRCHWLYQIPTVHQRLQIYIVWHQHHSTCLDLLSNTVSCTFAYHTWQFIIFTIFTITACIISYSFSISFWTQDLALQQILSSIELSFPTGLIPRTLGPSNDFTLLKSWICLQGVLVGFQMHFKSLHFHSLIHSSPNTGWSWK